MVIFHSYVKLPEGTHMEKNRINFRTHWMAIVCLLNLLVMQFWPTLQLEPPKGVEASNCHVNMSNASFKRHIFFHYFSLSSGCCIDHVSSIYPFFELGASLVGGPEPRQAQKNWPPWPIRKKFIASIARWSTWLPCKDKATCGTWSPMGTATWGWV